MRIILGVVIGFIIAFGVSAMRHNTSSHLGDGSYTVYSINEMHDTKTGAPVYWMVAGRGTYATDIGVYIEPDIRDIRLYVIPRGNLKSLVGSPVSSAPRAQVDRIDVKEGIVSVVRRLGSAH